MAELIKYYIPSIVQLHNYPAANSTVQKRYNWNTLNYKVLKKLEIHLTKEDIENIVFAKSQAIEQLLLKVYEKIGKYKPKENNEEKSKEYEEQGVKNASSSPKQPNRPESPEKIAFYQSQMEEKNTIIRQLKAFIEAAEKRVKQLGEEKTALNEKIKECTEKLRIYGINV